MLNLKDFSNPVAIESVKRNIEFIKQIAADGKEASKDRVDPDCYESVLALSKVPGVLPFWSCSGHPPRVAPCKTFAHMDNPYVSLVVDHDGLGFACALWEYLYLKAKWNHLERSDHACVTFHYSEQTGSIEFWHQIITEKKEFYLVRLGGEPKNYHLAMDQYAAFNKGIEEFSNHFLKTGQYIKGRSLETHPHYLSTNHSLCYTGYINSREDLDSVSFSCSEIKGRMSIISNLDEKKELWFSGVTDTDSAEDNELLFGFFLTCSFQLDSMQRLVLSLKEEMKKEYPEIIKKRQARLSLYAGGWKDSVKDGDGNEWICIMDSASISIEFTNLDSEKCKEMKLFFLDQFIRKVGQEGFRVTSPSGLPRNLIFEQGSA